MNRLSGAVSIRGGRVRIGIVFMGLCIVGLVAAMILSKLDFDLDEEIDVNVPILSEEERTYLWDIEHGATVLGEFGLAKFRAALASNSQEELRALMADDFTGEIAVDSVAHQTQDGLLSAVHENLAGAQAASVGADDFAAHLLKYRESFTGAPKVSTALMTLTPLERGNLDSSWRGRWRVRMSNPPDTESPREVTLFLDFQILRPTENSLTSGRWIEQCRISRSLATSAPRQLLQNVTSEWGLDTSRLHDNWVLPPAFMVPTPGGVYVFDFNRDSVCDMLVTDVTAKLTLYQGEPNGGFHDVTEHMGLMRVPTNVAVVADLDGDGWEDIVLGPGMVLKNEQGRRFRDATGDSNLMAIGNLSAKSWNGAAIADFDRDGLLDVYLCRGNSRPDKGSWLDKHVVDGVSNSLLRNLGNFQFEDVTEKYGADGDRRSSFTAAWFDADNDGWPDLYVINEFGNGILLVNKEGRGFQPHDLVDEPADFGSMGVTAGDINNDGLIDMYVASMYSKSGSRVIGNLKDDAYSPDIMHQLRRMVAGSELYMNAGSQRFDRIADDLYVSDVGWAYGPALVDLDNDGFEDLFATSGFLSRTRAEPDG